jgi:hypothetical protein
MCNIVIPWYHDHCSKNYLKVRKIKSLSELWVELMKPSSLLKRILVLEILCYVIKGKGKITLGQDMMGQRGS